MITLAVLALDNWNLGTFVFLGLKFLHFDLLIIDLLLKVGIFMDWAFALFVS